MIQVTITKRAGNKLITRRFYGNSYHKILKIYQEVEKLKQKGINLIVLTKNTYTHGINRQSIIEYDGSLREMVL